uniref:Uncharacterized protein n=1 Tax=Solanum lycopersicum TaxID=4081 RepID=A0A3Q7EDU5_SOLLC
MSTKVQIIKSSNVNSLPREEEMFLNCMDIKELLEAEWSSELRRLNQQIVFIDATTAIKIANFLWSDDNLEVQYKLRKEEKGKNLSKNETDPKDQGTNGLTKHMNNQVFVDVLLTDLEDYGDEVHVTNGARVENEET